MRAIRRALRARTTMPLLIVALIIGYNGAMLLISPAPLLPLWDGQPPIDAVVAGVLSLVAMVGIIRGDDRWGRRLGIALVVTGLVLSVVSFARVLTAIELTQDGVVTVVAVLLVGFAVSGFALFELVWRWPRADPQDQ